MNGKAHASVGILVGVGLSYFSGLSISEGATVTTATTAASLATDLDTAGTLANKVIKPFQIVINIIYSILFTMFIGSLIKFEITKEALIGVLILFSAIFLIKRIPIKIQMLIVSIGIGLLGYNFDKYSIILIACFIALASLLPHRSYTHTIIGLILFGYVSYQLQLDFGVDKLSLGMILGYVSHLVLDSKFIPGNKLGVKLFLPITNRQF